MAFESGSIPPQIRPSPGIFSLVAAIAHAAPAISSLSSPRIDDLEETHILASPGFTMPDIKPRTADGSSGHALSGEQVLDNAEDALLLVARELADFLEDAPGLAHGAALAMAAVFMAQQVIHRDMQHFREL